jgi:phospholipid/cholesterol/gamma-HCH transport system substrate-binding protein
MSAQKGQLGETLLGAIVAAVAVGFLSFAIARAGSGAGADGYELTARFDRIDGIASGADVRLSGVKVGSVSGVGVDPETYLAKVDFSVTRDVKIPDDSAVRIASDGLLGGAYVAIEPGGSIDMLPPGGEVLNTQGSIDLLTLFASFAQGGGGEPEESTP